MARNEDVADLLAAQRLKAWQNQRPVWAADVATRINALTAIRKEYWAARQRAITDPDANESGRRKAFLKVVEAVRPRVSAFEADTAAKIRDRARTLRATVLRTSTPQAPTDPAERIAYEFRLAAIRDELRKVDPMNRAALYMNSADPLVWAAVETAPPSIEYAAPGNPKSTPSLRPFVDPEHVAKAQTARVEAAHPEAASEVQDLEDLAGDYEHLVRLTRKMLDEDATVYGGAPTFLAEPVGQSA